MSASPVGGRGDGAAAHETSAAAGAIRGVLLAAAAALLVAAFLVPVTRAAGGGTSLEGWLLAQAGFAAIVACLGMGRATGRAALLASLFLLAAAAQLALTTPLWLQYVDLRPARLARDTGPVSAAVIALQAGVVLASLRGRIGRIAASLRSAASVRVVTVLALLFVFTAAHASPLFGPDGARHIGSYLMLLVAVLGLLCLNAVHLWLFVDAIPAAHAERWRARLGAWCSLPGEERAATTADVWIPRVLALFVLAAAVVVATAVFERVSHLPDDGVYLFHAGCAAAGKLSVAAPPVPEAFGSYLLDVRDGQWFATTNPGWPNVLALGVAAGAPWLVNPLLSAACVLMLHALVRRWSDRGTAHLVTLLLAVSPWFLFLAASFMTHALTLALLLAAWLLVMPREGTPRPAAAGLAGILLGYMVLVRPLDGLVAGGFTGFWLLARERRRWSALVPYALGCVAGSIWLFVYNASFTGRALKDPMSRYLDVLWYPGCNRLGFGADVGNVPGQWGGLDPMRGHGPLDVLVNLNQNLYNLNFELFGWSVGSLALIAVHALCGRWNSRDRWMAGLAVAVPAVFSCYWFSGGPDFGARYWFLMIVPCIWLTARGAATLSGMLRERGADPLAAARVAAGMALLALVAIVTFVPWRAAGRYVDYRGFHADFRRLAESGHLGRSLVLVKSTAESDVDSALYLNPPDLDPAGPLFARDLGPDVEKRLRAAYPDRPVVHALGRSVTGTVAQIVDAPR